MMKTMKLTKLLSVALVTIVALTVVTGAGVMKVRASSDDPTSDEIAQALGCAEITTQRGWMWSYATVRALINTGDPPKSISFILIADQYSPHSEASVTVSQVKGPLTLGWEWDEFGASYTCSVLDPNGVIVASTSYSDYRQTIDVPSDGRLYKIVWMAQYDYDGSSNGVTAQLNSVWRVNHPPIANAGADQVVLPNTDVRLDGRASSDRDLDPLTYLWSVTGSPTGSRPQLIDPTTAQPTLRADKHGAYTIQLVVKDSSGAQSSPDTVVVTQNVPPIITAATATQNGVGAPLFLQGSATDADNDPLTYQWLLTNKPEGSTVQLGLVSTTSIGGFVADVAGTYTAQLKASDGTASATQVVSVVVGSLGGGGDTPTKTSVLADLATLKTTLKNQPKSAIDPGKKIALLADLSVVEQLVKRGHYDAAAKLLDKTVLPRMDGCIKSGAPDRNDYVKPYDIQLRLYQQAWSLVQDLKWLEAHPT